MAASARTTTLPALFGNATPVLHQPGGPRVREAGRESLGQPDRSVGLAKQQGAGVRGDRATVEARHHGAAFDG